MWRHERRARVAVAAADVGAARAAGRRVRGGGGRGPVRAAAARPAAGGGRAPRGGGARARLARAAPPPPRGRRRAGAPGPRRHRAQVTLETFTFYITFIYNVDSIEVVPT